MIDGRGVTSRLDRHADVVVVGSGPAGSASARRLAAAGLRVVVVEEGDRHLPASFPGDAFSAMGLSYRGMGATVSRGRAPLPIVQGCAVGGTSVVNGAISWRLPEDIRAGWIADDPGLAAFLDPAALDAAAEAMERRLGIAPTPADLAGSNSAVLARGAAALGLEHRPISRNVRGCQGSGRCLLGCPHGAKQSMDLTLLADAEADGAELISGVRVERVLLHDGAAVGVVGRARGGGRVVVHTDLVVLAASAIQTPLLLRASGLRSGPVGDRLQGHPGAGVLARFETPIRCWEGATQGHEVVGLRRERLKFESLGLDRGMLASRLPGLGRAWSAELERLDGWASVGVALKARAQGTVRRGVFGQTVVRYEMTPEDRVDLARGIAVAGRMMFAAGAVEVLPGVHGFDVAVTDAARLDALERHPPRDPRAYSVVMTHLFGTARMASSPEAGVVRPDLRHHPTRRLYVMDSSVFPSNTGVNPQTSILTLADLAARRLAASLGTGRHDRSQTSQRSV